MEKNENGLPEKNVTPRGAMPNGTAGDNARDNENTAPRAPQNGMNGSANGNGENRNGGCNGLCAPLEGGCVNLAYVYAPWQKFCMLYSQKDALDHGTLFEGLYKPREVYYNE